jgi:predicted LPLAT superfamily acyltransferase
VLHFVTRLESELRARPLQWANFYPFWESAA